MLDLVATAHLTFRVKALRTRSSHAAPLLAVLRIRAMPQGIALVRAKAGTPRPPAGMNLETAVDRSSALATPREC